jgi:enoyl-CoA hydratase/carnithine racemase
MDFPEYKFIKLSHKRKITLLTLNRPEKKNALSFEFRKEMIDCLDYLSKSDKVHAVIIYGGDDFFCAGFDKDELIAVFQEKMDKNAYNRNNLKYHEAFVKFPKLLIAAINGFALGGGFDIAVLCHLRIGSKSAIFGHPEINFGGTPLYFPLEEIVGRGKALEICLNTFTKEDYISAEKALQLGILNKLSLKEELINNSFSMAKSILSSPKFAIDTLIKISGYKYDRIELLRKEFETVKIETENHFKT